MAAPTAAMRWRRPPGAAGGSGGRWSCQARARCAWTARARSAPPPGPRPPPHKAKTLFTSPRPSGNELLLELTPPCLQPPADAGPQTHASAEDEVVLRAVKRFYNLGVKPEWWKLAPM